MIEDRNIVCVASNWDDHPTSKHHLMRLLSEHNHVVWVNYHASRRPALTRSDTRAIARRLWQARRSVRRVAPNIDVLSPLLIPFPEARSARFINSRALARQIRLRLRQLPQRPTQLWLFTPDVPELIELIPAERVVYYCVDEFSAFSGFNESLIRRLEERTIRASDVVITTSATLQDQRRGLNPNTHMVPHGVDYDHFAASDSVSPDQVPEEICDIPRPIFGYFGLISDYVDLELIGQAARARPQWSFVFLGDVRRDTAPIDRLENVYLLGGRSYESLPGYCSRFDVGLIPFRMNRLTRAVNPIKLREYLAAGLPVVSSPMPEVLRYQPAVTTAESLDEFLPACATALAIGQAQSPAERRQLVVAESWQSRLEVLSELIRQTAPLVSHW